ncbi:hypothetical protein [Longimonas halophila]|nr:hypothetical protein [Longimonas halophila]
MRSLLRFSICTCFLIVTVISTATAQRGAASDKTEQMGASLTSGSLALKAGLSQPLLLSGANIAASYKTDRWVVEYSHGMWLSYDRVGRTDAERAQDLDLDSPWTTGFGLGYRLPWRFDLRVEFKAHRYRVTPPGSASFAYTTFSIGPALNYHQPVYNGLGFDLTVRFWPNVTTTIKDDQQAFVDSEGNQQVHNAHDLGVFPNVSLTYTF